MVSEQPDEIMSAIAMDATPTYAKEEFAGNDIANRRISLDNLQENIIDVLFDQALKVWSIGYRMPRQPIRRAVSASDLAPPSPFLGSLSSRHRPVIELRARVLDFTN